MFKDTPSRQVLCWHRILFRECAGDGPRAVETLGRQTSLTPSQKGIREGLLTGVTSKFTLRIVAFLQGRRMGVPGRRHSPATGPGRTAGTIAYFNVTGAERARGHPEAQGGVLSLDQSVQVLMAGRGGWRMTERSRLFHLPPVGAKDPADHPHSWLLVLGVPSTGNGFPHLCTDSPPPGLGTSLGCSELPASEEAASEIIHFHSLSASCRACGRFFSLHPHHMSYGFAESPLKLPRDRVSSPSTLMMDLTMRPALTSGMWAEVSQF